MREVGRLAPKARVEDSRSNGAFVNGDERLRKVVVEVPHSVVLVVRLDRLVTMVTLS